MAVAIVPFRLSGERVGVLVKPPCALDFDDRLPEGCIRHGRNIDPEVSGGIERRSVEGHGSLSS